MKRLILIKSFCPKIEPKLMIFLYKSLLGKIGIRWNGFSFVNGGKF
jgi:hypothetical protein